MNSIIRLFDHILDILVVLALMGMIAVLGIQVFYRYILNNPLVWPMPVSLFLFVWAIWLGGAAGIRDQSQIRVELAERYLPFKIKRILMPAISLICSLFLLVVIYKSFEVVELQASAIYDTLPISRLFLFIVAPIVGTIMFLQYIRVIVRQIKEYYFQENGR